MDKRPEGYQNTNRYVKNTEYSRVDNQQRYTSMGSQNISREQQMRNRSNNVQKRNGKNYSNKRTVSKPKKRGFMSRVFRDKRGKLNLLGKVAVGALTISTVAGIGVTGRSAYDTLKFNAFVHGEDYQKIVETIGDNYDNSEYLQVSIPREAYDEYTKKTLKSAIKNEPNMQDFLKQEEFSPEVWAYLLTGENDRSEISDQEILEALSDFLPYADYDSDSKEEDVLDNNISNFAFMTEYCTSDKTKNNVVNLLDSVIGESSLSNNTEALKYKIKLNEEEIERIQYNTASELQEKIYTNDNFDKLSLGSDSTLYLKPYIEKFYNSRVEFVSEKLNDESAPELLKNILKKYAGYEKMDGVNSKLRAISQKAMKAMKIADYSEYKTYTALRNELYSKILEEQANPEEAVENIEKSNLVLQTRVGYQEALERFDIPQYMSEVNELLEEMRDNTQRESQFQEEQEQIKEKSSRLSFDDFDR